MIAVMSLRIGDNAAMNPIDDAPDRRFDLIAFDWDGTLFDSTASIVQCLQQAVVDVGGQRPTRELASYVIGLALPEALGRVAPDVPSSSYRQLSERYRFHYTRHMNDITLFDGVPELLADLRAQGYLLAVATGKSRRGLREALEAVQLRTLFDATRTAEETAGKPDPLMLNELMAELAVPTQRTLMIGDTTHDLQMAHNAGCPSVAVSYGAHGTVGFDEWQPLHVADSIANLRQWLLER